MKCHSLSHGVTRLTCKTMVFFFSSALFLFLFFNINKQVSLQRWLFWFVGRPIKLIFKSKSFFRGGGYPETPSGTLTVQELWQAPNCVIVLPLSPWCVDETQASLRTASIATSETIQFSQHTAVSLDTCCLPNCCRKARLSTLERPPSLSIFMKPSHPHGDTTIAEWSMAGW